MRYVLGRVLSTALFGLLLFASAGRVDWVRAWVYLGVVLLGFAGHGVIPFASSEALSLCDARNTRDLTASRDKPSASAISL